MLRAKLPEIKRNLNRKEIEQLEEAAEYYAIIKATELLEIAYSRDVVTTQEYNENCIKFISQFKSTTAALMNSGVIKDPTHFFEKYRVECPRAYDRLVKDGVPVTVMHGGTVDNRSDVKIVAETVQAFITAMDCVKLGQLAIDQLQPLISDVATSLNKIYGLPSDFEGLIKMKSWLQRLNGFRASHVLEEDDARQLSFDLENAYNSFHTFLSEKK